MEKMKKVSADHCFMLNNNHRFEVLIKVCKCCGIFSVLSLCQSVKLVV